MAPPASSARRARRRARIRRRWRRIAPRAAACLATRPHGRLPAAPTAPPARIASPAFADAESAASSTDRSHGRSAPRDNSGGGSGGRAQAAPRGERSAPDSGREQPASAAPRGERQATSAESGGSRAGGRRTAWRAPERRPLSGRRGHRANPPALRRIRAGYYGRPWYYRPAAFYGYGALGLGYFYYDPFWAGYPGYGYARTAAITAEPTTAAAITVAAATTAAAAITAAVRRQLRLRWRSGYYGTGHLRLKVKPRDAEVYVDGYYAGLVDDFDGTFQKLELEAGPHRIEVRKAGFATMTFEVRVPADESVTYRGELNPLP